MTRLLRISILLLAVGAVVTPLPSFAGFNSQTPADQLPYDLGDGPSSITIVDLNRDNKPELVVTNKHTNTVSVLLNNGNGGFVLKYRYATGVAPSAIAAGDFNNDGKPEVVVANAGSNTVTILRGNGDGSLGGRRDYPTGAVPSLVIVSEINLDNRPDLAVVNRYGNSISIMIGKGDGTFYPKTDFATGKLPYSATLTDANRDGKKDLLVTSCFDPEVSMLQGNGDGTFRPKVAYATAKRSCGLVIGNLDPDGGAGVIEPHRYGYLVSIQLVGDEGSSGMRSELLSGKGPRCVRAGDINRDGVPDLAVANGGHKPGEPGSVFIYLGRGTGAFDAKTSYVTGNASHSLALGDLNGDGKVDMAVLNGSYDFGGSVSVFLGNGDGTFRAKADYATGGYLIWVSFGDDAKKASEHAEAEKEKPPR
jgi:hypothetical protein